MESGAESNEGSRDEDDGILEADHFPQARQEDVVMSDGQSHPCVIALCGILMKQPNTSESKMWHSEIDSSSRQTIQQCVSFLIRQRRPNASQDWIDKLPEVIITLILSITLY
jgi:hypothetical protein